jgi:hypothetical protein
MSSYTLFCALFIHTDLSHHRSSLKQRGVSFIHVHSYHVMKTANLYTVRCRDWNQHLSDQHRLLRKHQ